MGKYSTSFTAHKGALNDFWKIVEEERSAYIDTVETIVNLEYLKHFVRTGQLKVKPEFWTDYKTQIAYLDGSYLGPVPGHINPLQEVNADAKSVEQGFALRSSIATKHGNDFWNMIDSWEEEQDRWSKASPEQKAKALYEEETKKKTKVTKNGEQDDE
jgi:capsid protein